MPVSEELHEARRKRIASFDANNNGLSDNGIFGLPFTKEEAQIVLLPVPWEVTVSYGEGTAEGPDAIHKASQQIDLYEEIYPDGWRAGIYMEAPNAQWKDINDNWRGQNVLYMHELMGEAKEISPHAREILNHTNKLNNDLKQWVKDETGKLLDEGKFVGIIGGEHSVPLGYLEALAERHPSFGILQIDAHADLRIAYEGFTYSHASIMYNAMQIPNIEKLIQVGIRDFSHEEWQIANQSDKRIMMFTERNLRNGMFGGASWKDVCELLVSMLPDDVYISFDIDGLQPWLCPNTGTPVPGGFTLEEAMYLLEMLVKAGKRVIGFDLCEVAPGVDEWDGNVGSRVLYKLCMLAAKTNGLQVD